MTERLMPDFAAKLEQRLRDTAVVASTRAQPAGTARRTMRWLPRLVVWAAASAALAIAIFAVTTSDDRRGRTAYGKPLILRTAPVANANAIRIVRQLQRGVSGRLVLGKDTHLAKARPVPVFGGTAYVVTGDTGWCLTAPDPSIDHGRGDPTRVGAVTCARTDTVYRYGIALGVGNNLIAAIPKGVRNPTLHTPDGRVQDMHPSPQGIVAADHLPHGSFITLYAPDGTRRSLKLP